MKHTANISLVIFAIIALCLSSFDGHRPSYAPQNDEISGDTIIAFIGDTTYDTIYSEGTVFWCTFMFQDNWGDNYLPGQIDSSILELMISSRFNTPITISNPNTGWEITTNIKQDSLQRIVIPKKQGFCEAFDGKIEQKGLVIKSLQPISVYASNFHYASFDATNVLPLVALGNEYVIQTYIGETTTDIAGLPYGSNYNFWLNGVACFFHTYDTIAKNTIVNYDNYRDTIIDGETVLTCDTIWGNVVQVEEHVPAVFAIIATEDNTVVKITPTIDLYDGHPANTEYTITLNQGETYQAVGSTEIYALSGTHIIADKRIAVFCGNICTNIPNVDGNCCCDHLVEQAMPLNMWGKTFIVTKAYGQRYNEALITALHDNTEIKVNNVVVDNINAYETKKIILDDPDVISTLIETSDSVACYMYFGSAAYASTIGDPSMVWVTPIEQRIKQKTFSTFTYNEYNSNIDSAHHYVNIVATTESLSDMMLDDENIASAFEILESNPEYSFARYNIKPGTHTLTNLKDGFAAHVYGIGIYESYAYNVGLSLEIPHETFAQINWDIHTICDNSTKLNIKFDALEQIDSVRFYSAHNSQIKYSKAFNIPHTENLTYEIKHPDTDTIYAFSYVGDTQKHNFSLVVKSLFPATVLHQKWNDFIGVLTDNEDGMFNNGGYNFIEYQWYKDGRLLAGETNSYLYRPLEIGAEYSAMLTTADGIKSMTCPLVAIEKTDIMNFPTIVNEAEMLRCPIIQGAEMYIYNTTGQLISHQHLTPDALTFRAPEQQGNYIVRFISDNGIYRTYKIIVI